MTQWAMTELGRVNPGTNFYRVGHSVGYVKVDSNSTPFNNLPSIGARCYVVNLLDGRLKVEAEDLQVIVQDTEGTEEKAEDEGDVEMDKE